MKIIIAFILGTLAGIFGIGLCSVNRNYSASLVFKAYSLLVQARDSGNIEEIVNVAEEAIGYLGMALEE